MAAPTDKLAAIQERFDTATAEKKRLQDLKYVRDLTEAEKEEYAEAKKEYMRARNQHRYYFDQDANSKAEKLKKAKAKRYGERYFIKLGMEAHNAKQAQETQPTQDVLSE